MTETEKPGLAPLGDRFEDQYTSATADLSAGGVAIAVEEMLAAPATTPARAAQPTPIRAPATGASIAESELGALSPGRRRIGMGVGAVLAASGGLGGAWLYARWQRQRNKPINRLRRNARDMASRLGERIPDVDELPHGAAPLSGAATALLLMALVATRALRRDRDASVDDLRDRAEELLRAAAEEALTRGHDAVKRGRKEALKQGGEAVRRGQSEETRKPAMMGIGLGGVTLVAGGAFVAWRLMQRGQPDRSRWYAGE